MSDQDPAEEERDEPTPAAAQPRTSTFSQKVGRLVIGIVVVLFAVFAVANAQPVDFSWIFGETQVEIDQTGARTGGGVPLIVLLGAAFVIGLFLGLVIAWQSNRKRRTAAER